MNKIYLESLDLQIELAKIIDDENEYNKLIRNRRNYFIEYILRKDEKQKEIDYFEDERDTES